ncbi:MAG: hypothetical protein V4760_16240 [Bdellovibrionota bacterium]
MSFTIVCECCGAPSGPSVGLCPFCKSVMSGSTSMESPTVTSLRKLFAEGKIEAALPLATQLLASVQGELREVRFLMLCVQVLFEAEAPTSKINALLSEAFLRSPEDQTVLEYMAVMDAKAKLKYEVDSIGEKILRDVLVRQPRHAHAAFLLGSHFFWAKQDHHGAGPLLELCVRERPGFLRAWACLGALYEQQDRKNLAAAAYRKCAELEPTGSMRSFFLERLDTVTGQRRKVAS